MKTIIITLAILIYSATLPDFAFGRDDYSSLPSEYMGFVEYHSVDSMGRDVVIKAPVRYRRATNRDYAENDSNNAVRDCRIELERANQKIKDNDEKQYSAKYYPLYYYQ